MAVEDLLQGTKRSNMWARELRSPCLLDVAFRIMVDLELAPCRDGLFFLLDVLDTVTRAGSAVALSRVLAWQRSILHWMFFASERALSSEGLRREDLTGDLSTIMSEVASWELDPFVWCGVKVLATVLSTVVLSQEDGWQQIEQTLLLVQECFPAHDASQPQPEAKNSSSNGTATPSATQGTGCNAGNGDEGEDGDADADADADDGTGSNGGDSNGASQVVTQRAIKAHVLAAVFWLLQSKSLPHNAISPALAANLLRAIMLSEEVIFPSPTSLDALDSAPHTQRCEFQSTHAGDRGRGS